MVYTGPERREFIRVNLCVPVKYCLASAPGEYIESKTEDISSGGMGILLRGELPPETILNLQFELLKEERTIRFDGLQARVVWVKPDPTNLEFPYKAGIQFINIDISERLRISNCIYYRTDLLRRPFR